MSIPSLQSRVITLDNARYRGGARARNSIDMIIMHATAGDSARSSIEWLNRSDVPRAERASYHYIIERTGIIYRMCPVHIVAYHAGDSAWPNPTLYPPGNGGHTLNGRSIGIAWANRDDGEPLTEAQIESGLWLCSVYCRGTDIQVPVESVLGHYEISPGRKVDPRSCMSLDTWREKLAEYLTT